MSSFLRGLWNKLVENLGQFGTLLSVLLGSLTVAIKDKDVGKIRDICDELDEFAGDLQVMTAGVRQRIADGVLTGQEGADSALELEQLIADLQGLVAKHKKS